MTHPVLAIENLSVALPPGSQRPYAVRGVSLAVGPGQTLCVVGESGSGKSVMASAVLRLLPVQLRHTQGRILLEGTDLSTLDAADMRALRGRRVGMVFQEPMTALNPVMTVGAQIEEVLLVHGWGEPRQRAQRVIELLEEMSLPQPSTLRHRFPFQLSGGQRQRILIAMAMALEPALLVCDEPTTALDVTTQAQILQLILRLQQRHRMGVMFITHDFGVVADIANQIVVMCEGEVVESGPAAQVLQHPRHAYTRKLIDAVPRLRREGTPAAPSRAPLLEVRGVTKRYPTRGEGMWGRRGSTLALDAVSFQLEPGETLGIVGESGSGKTTLGHCVMRLLDIDGGEILFDGAALHGLRGSALRAMRPRIQMIFQDPFASLNPRHRIGRVITENVVLAGVPAAEAQRRMDEVLRLVGLDPGVVQRFPHEFSGGQRQRIGIARALVMHPQLIVADEAVSALDVSVQQQVLALLRAVRERLGLAMLFITHDLRVASQVCDRIAVMQHGRIVELGPAASIAGAPQHPYTRQLFAAMPGQNWNPTAD